MSSIILTKLLASAVSAGLLIKISLPPNGQYFSEVSESNNNNFDPYKKNDDNSKKSRKESDEDVKDDKDDGDNKVKNNSRFSSEQKVDSSSIENDDGDDHQSFIFTDVSKNMMPLMIKIQILMISFGFLYFIHGKDSTIYKEWNLIEFLSFMILLLGSFLRLWSYRTLGKYFTFIVSIQGGHQLIQTGPYKYLMHPSYTGMLMALFSFQIFTGWTNEFYYWFPNISITLLLLLLRIPYEENLLKQHFAAEVWTEYKRTRWRLMPGIF